MILFNYNFFILYGFVMVSPAYSVIKYIVRMYLEKYSIPKQNNFHETFIQDN
jgi:hypothetical protein